MPGLSLTRKTTRPFSLIAAAAFSSRSLMMPICSLVFLFM